MAAPVIASLSGVNFTATSGSAPRPSGTSEGDLLVFIASSDTASTIPTYTVADFGGGAINLLVAYDASSYSGSTTTYQAWWKLATGAEPASYALGVSVSRLTAFHVLRITGHDAADPFDGVVTVSNDSGVASEPVAPGLTTSLDETLVIRSVAWDESKTLNAGPAGHALASHLDVTGHDQIVHYLTQAVAGAVGTASYNLSSGTRWIASTLAVRPSQGGGATGAGAAGLQMPASGAAARGAAGAGGSGIGLLAAGSALRGAAGAGAAALGVGASGAGWPQVAVTATGQAVLAALAAGEGSRGAAGTASATLAFAGVGGGQIVVRWSTAPPDPEAWSTAIGVAVAWAAPAPAIQTWAPGAAAAPMWAPAPPPEETWT